MVEDSASVTWFEARQGGRSDPRAVLKDLLSHHLRKDERNSAVRSPD
jgi:hypothetical protein